MTNRRSPIPTVISSFQRFLSAESAGGVLLLAATAIAQIWANSPLAPHYDRLWTTIIPVGIGSVAITRPLRLWINDGLMAVCLLMVGLEIKRELLVGELSSPRKALRPTAARSAAAPSPKTTRPRPQPAPTTEPHRCITWNTPSLPWVTGAIMPVFALANAGVGLGGDVLTALGSPVCLGIMAGRIAGDCCRLGVNGRRRYDRGRNRRPVRVGNHAPHDQRANERDRGRSSGLAAGIVHFVGRSCCAMRTKLT